MQKNSPQFKVFERALWAAYPAPSYRYDQAYWADPAGFLKAMNQSWTDQDWGKFALLGFTYMRNATPGPKLVVRLAFALVLTSRFEAAGVLLRARRAELEHEARYWRDLARADVGVGMFDEAAAALRRSLEIRPEDKEATALLAEVDAARDLTARLGQLTDWADFRRLADQLYEFGAVPRAAAVVQHFLARRLTPPEDIDDLLRAVQMTLSAIPPENVFAVVRDLQYAWGAGPERRLVRDTLDLLTGVTEESEGGASDDICKRDRELRFCMALALLAGGKRRVAMERLGRMSDRFKHDWEARLVLARATGEELLSNFRVTYRTDQTPKVFDLIMFNNERELLQAKLAEEDDWVDTFVIVESNRTFTGLEKPFHFEAWKSEFSRYAHKIVHVKVDSYPDWANTPWAREFYQRDMGAKGASGLWGVDDLVMLTDSDEIVDRRAVEGFDSDYAALLMQTYRYYLNYQLSGPLKYTGVVVRAKYLQRFGVSFARNMLRSYRLTQTLDNAGWHFTSIFDTSGVAAKMRSFSHQEYAHMDEAYFERIYEKINRKKIDGWDRVPIDEMFPNYIRENQQDLAQYILPVESTEPAQ